MAALEQTGPDPRRPRVLPGGAAGRRRPRHRPPPQGRRRRRHPGPPGRRPAGRARGRCRPLDPPRPSSSSPSGWSAATGRRWSTGVPAPRSTRTASTTSWYAAWPSARSPRAPTTSTGDNVFAMVRRIGQAKAELAADYAAQLARSAGKVVFFAKHLDVMDAAQEVFAKRDIRYTDDPRRPDLDRRAHAGHRLLRQRPRRRGHRLLADRRRRRDQPPGLLERRARRALLDQRRADPGDRPGAPDRPARARHRLADHRRPDHRRQDRRADRRQGRPRRPRPRRRRARRPPRRPTSRSRPWSRCSPTRSPRAPTTTESPCRPDDVGHQPSRGSSSEPSSAMSRRKTTDSSPSVRMRSRRERTGTALMW